MRGHELNCKYHNVASLAQLEKKRTGEPGTRLLPQGGQGALGPASSRCSTTETSALPVRQLSDHIKHAPIQQLKKV